MKIYLHLDQVPKENWKNLNKIAKYITRYHRSALFPISTTSGDAFHIEKNIHNADVALLTYDWNYYVNQGVINEALSEISFAKKHHKPAVVFCGGDHPANLPFEDVVLFEKAGYRSTPGLLFHSAYPTTLPDILQTYCDGIVQTRSKKKEPTVGFCGQASASPIQALYRKLRLKWQQRQYRQGSIKWEPPPFETTSFRARILKSFENQPGIQANYIPRTRYWAGETKNKTSRHPAKLEFVNNILDSDYTVCMRGGGNFSVRFYETLCLGRIPIFIDTDCLLPFQDEIDYPSYFPWIDVQDLPHAAEILRDFHTRLSADDFIDLQKACRDLWLEHMTSEGFHQDFVNKINTLKGSAHKAING